MKRLLITILMTLNIHAQVLEVTKDWKLFGAIQNIDVVGFEQTCVDYIWKYTDNNWYLFSNKTVTIDHNPLFDIPSGDGFWVKGSRDCTVEVNPEPIDITVDNSPLNYTISDEYSVSGALEQVNALYAYEQNLSGRGTVVAVIDSGITSTHEDLDDNIKYYTSLRDDIEQGIDDIGHGTHVAGIIGAEYNSNEMHGIAFNTNLISIKITDEYGKHGHQFISRACELAQQKGAKVANMSLSTEWYTAYEAYIPTYEEALNNDLTMIMAAGNDSADVPSYPALLPSLPSYADFTNKLGGFIAVGAVDSNNEIAGYSNKAGTAKDWYIVAPGTVYSTHLDNSYQSMNGTSMATPVVTGAFALISELRPDLSGSEIANILFQTATDLGEPGVDEIYGHGLLNVEEAVKLATNY